MAGIAALLNQKMGRAQGNLNPRLYALAATPGNGVFHDVTVSTSGVSSCDESIPSMCNNSTPGPTGLSGGLAGYLVGPGYDEVTGLGSIDVANLLAQWALQGQLQMPAPVTFAAQQVNTQSAPMMVTVTNIGGSAVTVSNATCSSGQLTYSFSDGTGRTGTIPLTRLLQNATCSTTTPYTTNADFALSGNWYAPATSGQGFTIEVNPNSNYLFIAWYTYRPDGAAAGAPGLRWYTAQASFTPGSRFIPVQIYATTGGVFNTPAPAPATLVVGSGTLAFQSCTAATFTYAFTGGDNSGLSGTISLSRVGPVPPGCTS